MCGLSGIVQRTPDDRLRAGFLAASRIYLRRRGPDNFSHADILPGLTFAHARGSPAIIDLQLGNQPITDDAGAIVFNGEIYNYREKRYKDAGHRTHSDTEVLLKGLNREGLKFLNDADGMFAFAYVNRKERKLVLARDLFGIKPIYYFFDGETFAFASRLQPLMLLSKKEIDRQGFVEYYAGRARAGRRAPTFSATSRKSRPAKR